MIQAEGSRPLQIDKCQLNEMKPGFNGVLLISLPRNKSHEERTDTWFLQDLSENLGDSAVIIVTGQPVDLVGASHFLSSCTYQTWIVIKSPLEDDGDTVLDRGHYGAIIYTRYKGPLQHCKTRFKYTYCPACKKTTKDYGGKKHTFHEFGTLISDVWKDEFKECDLPVIFSKLFGLKLYDKLLICELPYEFQTNLARVTLPAALTHESIFEFFEDKLPSNTPLPSQLILGDCLAELKKLETNCIDFGFVDPPYNLNKKYSSYEDDLEIENYFEWCDNWIDEMARVLKPRRTLAILNIPLWCIRHFHHLETRLNFQSWIAWDGLSVPLKKIMPAHYGIVCFSKGPPRSLPMCSTGVPNGVRPFEPQAFYYCLRSSCIKKREDVRATLSDLWWDIHRLKHNSRRVDHPCLLPPNLMYRLISVYTNPGETVLDCFNGAGTTTLAAHQLGRNYLGIELDPNYHEMSVKRHQEIAEGKNPFRKEKRNLAAKNSTVPRVQEGRRRYSKKEIQLDVKAVAENLGRMPTKKEYLKSGQFSSYVIETYFFTWGEACAAARTTGMTELPSENLS